MLESADFWAAWRFKFYKLRACPVERMAVHQLLNIGLESLLSLTTISLLFNVLLSACVLSRMGTLGSSCQSRKKAGITVREFRLSLRII